ncbi:Cilia- and flagella-associated protein 43, partial [Podochytrium sp. JEL0797]
MPPTLFGELEVSKSYGHTPFNNPRYITPHVICYISGNAINFIDTASTTSVRSASAKPNHVKPILADAQITALGICRKESLIAYGERGSAAVRLVKYPLGSVVAHFGQDNTRDISVSCIEFSHDSKYLASMSGLPGYRITVWDWKNNSMMALSGAIEGMDGVDDEGVIKFWKLDIGFKQNTLKCVTGHECCLFEQLPAELRAQNTTAESALLFLSNSDPPLIPKCHAWQEDQQVVATVESGDAVVMYNPAKGDSRLLFTAWKSRYQVEKERTRAPSAKKGVMFAGDARKSIAEPEQGRKSVVAETSAVEPSEVGNLTREDFIKAEYGGTENFKHVLVVNKDSLILGGKDGVLRFVNYDGDLEFEIPVLQNGSEITGLQFSPNFQEICITSSDQCIHVYNLETQHVRTELQIESIGVVAMSLFAISDTFVTAHKDGVIKFWDPDTKKVAHKFSISGNISTIATHPLSSVLAVGTSTGVLRIYDASFNGSETPRLLMREKISLVALKNLAFDPTGRYLLAHGEERRAVFVDILNNCSILGFIRTPSFVKTAVWDIEEMEDRESRVTTNLILYLLVQGGTNNSAIMKYKMDENLTPALAAGLTPGNFLTPSTTYNIDEIVSDFAVVSS